jgi:hypothetical protein
VPSTLAQHDGVRQGGRARRDVHGGSSSKVEAAHLEHPALGVPGPASNRVVDDRRPDEHEDDTGQHAAALSDGADGQRHRDGGEHALVDGEQQVGDPGGADGRRGQDVAEADVLKVTDVLAGRVREGQRIAPEEPLEGDDGGGHDGEPDEGEGGLAPCEARVEEAGGKRDVSIVLLLHVCWVEKGTSTYPTPGIMRSTRAVEVIIQAISPGWP